MKNEIKKILLIKSGKAERYWLYFDAIEKKVPESKHIPAYYRKKAADFKTWFRTVKIEVAPNDIMSKCYVKSSGAVLSNASRHSMSPYFIITTEE